MPADVTGGGVGELPRPKAQRSGGPSDGFLQRTLTLQSVRELRATPCFKETKRPDKVETHGEVRGAGEAIPWKWKRIDAKIAEKLSR